LRWEKELRDKLSFPLLKIAIKDDRVRIWGGIARVMVSNLVVQPPATSLKCPICDVRSLWTVFLNMTHNTVGHYCRNMVHDFRDTDRSLK
jgi:hypothetical protein